MSNRVYVYRSRDLVAISPPDGATFYLSREEAEALYWAIGGIMGELADSVPFGQSPFQPRTIHGAGDMLSPARGAED